MNAGVECLRLIVTAWARGKGLHMQQRLLSKVLLRRMVTFDNAA